MTTQEIGAGTLKRRFDHQKIHANRLKEYCDDILSTLIIVQQSSHLSATKIAELESKQSRMHHKLLVVMRKLELFRLHNRPLTPDEQRYFKLVAHLFIVFEISRKIGPPCSVTQNALNNNSGTHDHSGNLDTSRSVKYNRLKWKKVYMKHMGNY